jgi:hypothetical protein
MSQVLREDQGMRIKYQLERLQQQQRRQ